MPPSVRPPAPAVGLPPSRAVLGQVEQDGLHPAVGLALLGEAELGEQRADVLLHRALGETEGRADRGIVLPLGDLGEDLPLAGSQVRQR